MVASPIAIDGLGWMSLRFIQLPMQGTFIVGEVMCLSVAELA